MTDTDTERRELLEACDWLLGRCEDEWDGFHKRDIGPISLLARFVRDTISAPQWTKEPPKVAGEYSWRWGSSDDKPRNRTVHVLSNGTVIATQSNCVFETVAVIGGEWSGPITPPEGDKP